MDQGGDILCKAPHSSLRSLCSRYKGPGLCVVCVVCVVMDTLRAEIAHVSKQISDLELAYFAGTAGVESGVLPLGPYKVVNKKASLFVRRDQRVFSISASGSGDGGTWPEAAHSPQALAAVLASAGPRRTRKNAKALATG